MIEENIHDQIRPTQNITMYFDKSIIFLWGMFFILFPVIFAVPFTNPFFIPKQLFLMFLVLVSLSIWGVKSIIAGKISFRRTPFDIPILCLLIIAIISGFLAINRYDSFISIASLFAILVSYFVIINHVKRKNDILFLFVCLIFGASMVGLMTITSFFTVYLLPFSYTHTPSFTPLGSLLDQALYLLCILPLAGYLGYPLLKGKANTQSIGSVVAFIVLSSGLLVTILQLATTQKPLILPFVAGFQIAFAAISQDSTRIFQGFFFGSGFGNFLTDFTRFKLPTYNANQSLWYITFTQSSSFILELLTTTGILGLLSFLAIFIQLYRKPFISPRNPLFLALTFIIIGCFILPLSLSTLALLFFLLAIFAAVELHKNPHMFYDVELRTVAVRKLQEKLTSKLPHSQQKISTIVPIVIAGILIILSATIGYFAGIFALSDMALQNSLVAAQSNNGTQAYQSALNAIKIFPYRDTSYRVFSQINIALANSIVALKPKDKNLTDQNQQTLYKLIQQAIDAGKNATVVSPQTVTNWTNLSSIYRALIGFGQNADQFAISTNQTAIALDPTNPQEYIALGGIYYQLQQYDKAASTFQSAISLKSDFANAYYNLGHAFEQKGDYTNALIQYQTVQQLVEKDRINEKKITDEITALESKINTSGKNAQATSEKKVEPSNQQQALDVNKINHAFPTHNPQITIPAPTVPAVPSVSPTVRK